MNSPSDNRRFERRTRRRLSGRVVKYGVITLAIGVSICFLARNSIARIIGTAISSRVLSTRVEIESVKIGWTAISINGITVYEPAIPDASQFSVRRVRALPCLGRGLKTGVWLTEVVVTEPVGHLRFDRDGRLLSVFPNGGSDVSAGPVTIPVENVHVHDAAIVVHQLGRDDLRIANIAAKANADRRIKAVVAIPDLMGGRLRWQCDVDAVTLEGLSELAIDGLSLDSDKLAKLPLVPPGFGTHRISADFEIQVKSRHPANELDIRKHLIRGHVSTKRVRSEQFGILCDAMDLHAHLAGGSLEVTAYGNPCSGELDFKMVGNLIGTRPTLAVRSKLSNCRPDAFVRQIPRLENLEAAASGSTNWVLDLDGDRVHFHGGLSADVAQATYDRLPLPAVRARLETQGSFLITDPSAVRGLVRGSIDSEAIDVADIASASGLTDGSGIVVASSEFSIPLESLTDLGSYTASAVLKAEKLTFSELKLDDAAVKATLNSGMAFVDTDGFILRDQNGRAIVKLQSTTEASLQADGRVTSTAELFVEPSFEVAKRLGIGWLDPVGRVLVTTTATCPTKSATDPEAWSAEARLQTHSIAALGETISDIDGHASLTEGMLAVSPLAMKWREHVCLCNLSGTVGPLINLRGDFVLDALRVNDLSQVFSRYAPVRPLAEGLANIQGEFAIERGLTGDQKAFTASGLAELKNAQFANVRIGNGHLRWSADLQGLTVTTSSHDFLGGRYRVSAHMKDLDWTQTEIDGAFEGIEASRLVGIAGQVLPVSGIFNGGFELRSASSVEELSGEAWLLSRQLSVRGLPIEIANTKIVIDNGRVSASSSGSVAEGRFSIHSGGSLPDLVSFFESETLAISKVPLQSQIKLAGLRVESLERPFGFPDPWRDISATLSVECSRDPVAADGRHVCLASATVEDVRYQHRGLSQRIAIDTVVYDNRFEVTGIRGRIADGALSGSGVVMFDQSPSGRFHLAVNRVNLRRASSPFGLPGISGTGSMSIRGRIGPVITGQLDLSVDNAVAAGVGVRQARFPVDWSWRPLAMTGRWQCRAGSVSAGGGNVRIASEGSYSGGIDTTTSVRVDKIDLARLLQNRSVGSGTVNGELLVRAKHATAAKDLVGTFGFELQHINAMKIPILDQLPKTITLSPPIPGRGQDGGTVRGRIGGGLIHFDEIAIHQSNVQVLVFGNATMTGKLNLDIVANTESNSPTEQLVSLLDSPLMLAAPAPVALLVKANELLKDRVVRVHVGGTANRPTLRLQPGKQLSQDAVRFFLSNSFGSTVGQLSETQSKYYQR